VESGRGVGGWRVKGKEGEVGVASKMAGTVISWKIHAELSPRKVYHKYFMYNIVQGKATNRLCWVSKRMKAITKELNDHFLIN
jgi:hypothetical protein